jgi:hypothetical protein
MWHHTRVRCWLAVAVVVAIPALAKATTKAAGDDPVPGIDQRRTITLADAGSTPAPVGGSQGVWAAVAAIAAIAASRPGGRNRR